MEYNYTYPMQPTNVNHPSFDAIFDLRGRRRMLYLIYEIYYITLYIKYI
jgi:hypothetical protein